MSCDNSSVSEAIKGNNKNNNAPVNSSSSACVNGKVNKQHEHEHSVNKGREEDEESFQKKKVPFK